MTDLEGGEYTDKVIEIFLVLSRSDVVVKKAVTAVPVLKRVSERRTRIRGEERREERRQGREEK